MSQAFHHPWMSGLFGDDRVAQILSWQSELDRMRQVEHAWTLALAQTGDAAICRQAARHIMTCDLDLDQLRAGMARDGMVVPDLVRQIKAGAPCTQHKVIHQGLTSQDVIDTSLVLALQEICPIFDRRLSQIDTACTALVKAHGDRPLMGRTRMQAALPIRVADRVLAWAAPLAGLRARLDRMRPDLLVVQYGGPVGRRDIPQADAVMTAFAARLGLGAAPRAWHTNRAVLLEFAGWLSQISTSLGKIGQDIALMAQMGGDEITLASGGGSSAMPHKQNPILAELLVTLARYNAAQLSAMHSAGLHEQERSGTAWTLEWMVLPDMLASTGRSLVAARDVLAQINSLGTDPGPPAQ